MAAGFPIIILFLLLLFPQISISGAADGLTLWFHTVLPTLAPFMICTRLISSLGGIPILMCPVSPLFQAIFGLSESGSYILCCGLLCGYPLGAGLCAEFVRESRISKREAQVLLAICNHPSPMFLTGYVTSLMTVKVSVPLMLFCLYFPVLPISFIARRIYQPVEISREKRISSAHAAERYPGKSPAKGLKNASFDQILTDTSEAMVLIGNSIMLFSILACWIRQLSFLPTGLCALCVGFTEITTGTKQICEAFPGKKALLPVLMATAFGGLSGIFQTNGVISYDQEETTSGNDTKNTGIPDGTSRTKDTGLSIRHYIGWKILHTLLTSVCVIALT